MKTRRELKSEITHKIMELRQKELVEADCILDVLDDCLDPFIDELEQENLENDKIESDNIEESDNDYENIIITDSSVWKSVMKKEGK